MNNAGDIVASGGGGGGVATGVCSALLWTSVSSRYVPAGDRLPDERSTW
ncbi:hypothetical protein PPL_01463 [Heterostelium album PN500]|uniref:Uncharacterized protein n=1 Tax=Heterostelium pallidum (strain ATCC 26659 / Pp 5 / PN500) TaxID=670386 RepID=D3AZC3_HETP5|nr:hypothetical protein PPL_01463 [Heterostelium album PN500]EFA85506.1 hypothetical protein PPL_01463 [Heterostelium album PN500]|eukprot:XP_020437614.1 hypothetical protein PPL_01463 [Heterostelium album PN500]